MTTTCQIGKCSFSQIITSKTILCTMHITAHRESYSCRQKKKKNPIINRHNTKYRAERKCYVTSFISISIHCTLYIVSIPTFTSISICWNELIAFALFILAFMAEKGYKFDGKWKILDFCFCFVKIYFCPFTFIHLHGSVLGCYWVFLACFVLYIFRKPIPKMNY